MTRPRHTLSTRPGGREQYVVPLGIQILCRAAGCGLPASLASPWVPIVTALSDNGAHTWFRCANGHVRAARWTPDDVTDGWIGGPPGIPDSDEGMLL